MYRSSPFRSTLNTGYITGLDMCKVCTEAVHCVALWTRVCAVCTEAVHSVALWTRVTLGLGMCKVCTEAVHCVAKNATRVRGPRAKTARGKKGTKARKGCVSGSANVPVCGYFRTIGEPQYFTKIKVLLRIQHICCFGLKSSITQEIICEIHVLRPSNQIILNEAALEAASEAKACKADARSSPRNSRTVPQPPKKI